MSLYLVRVDGDDIAVVAPTMQMAIDAVIERVLGENEGDEEADRDWALSLIDQVVNVAAIDQALGQLKAAADALREPIDVPEVTAAAAETAAYKIGGRARTSAFAPSNEAAKIDMRRVAAPAATRSAAPGRQPSAPAAGLDGPMQRVLDALAELEQLGANEPRRELVAFLAGYSNTTSKGFANAVSALSSSGRIRYPSRGFIALTPDGAALARAPGTPTTPREAQERICTLLGGASTRILQPLIEAYPNAIPRDQLGEAAGYTNTTSKGFANAVSRLSSLGFVEYPERGMVRAAPLLFLEDSR